MVTSVESSLAGENDVRPSLFVGSDLLDQRAGRAWVREAIKVSMLETSASSQTPTSGYTA